jgi:hypothetical protein
LVQRQEIRQRSFPARLHSCLHKFPKGLPSGPWLWSEAD